MRPPVASVAAQLSGVVAAVGVVFLVLMYVGFATSARWLLVFGPLNDACVLAQYALALPVIGAFDRILAPLGAVQRHLIFATGIIGCLGAVVFQALLLLGLMSFRDQVVPASVSVLLAGLWTVVASLAARKLGALKVGNGLLVASGLYFGYPLWAIKVGRQLGLAGNRATPGQGR